MKSKNIAKGADPIADRPGRGWPSTPHEMWMPYAKHLMMWLNKNCVGYYFCSLPGYRLDAADVVCVRFELANDCVLAKMFFGGEVANPKEKVPRDPWDSL